MARLSAYPVEPNPDGSDILLGTDASGGTNATKNFRISDITVTVINKFLANNSWKFMTDAANAVATKASMYFAAGGGDNTAWSSISTIRLQTLMGNNSLSQPYLEYLLINDPATGLPVPAPDNIIKIMDRNDQSSFGVYTFNSITLVTGQTTVYDIGLTFVKGNLAIQDTHVYGIGLDPTAAQDKTFVFEQGATDYTWTINHNMNKYPSVSVVDSANSTVEGATVYTDKNNLTINFSVSFAGKAYLN